MIGSFFDAGELLSWAGDRARESRQEYAAGGNLVALGYALAMEDIAGSVMRHPDSSHSALRLLVPNGPPEAQPQAA